VGTNGETVTDNTFPPKLNDVYESQEAARREADRKAQISVDEVRFSRWEALQRVSANVDDIINLVNQTNTGLLIIPEKYLSTFKELQRWLIVNK
jgi:hypothetical protein